MGALIEAIAAVDGYTAKHSEGVARLARQVGERLGLGPSELVELELAALLHDVGKVRVPTRFVRQAGTPERVRARADPAARHVGG